MAHLTDERGNPIQLTDEFGNPVTLTDEHGNPMHLSGVAYATDTPIQGGHGVVGGPTSGTTVGEILSGGVGAAPVEGMGAGHGPRREVEEVGGATADIRRSSSSNSTSSEEEEVAAGELVEGEERGTRRRRKKKGITQKIKEKLSLTGSPKAKDAAGNQTTTVTTSPTAVPHKIATTDTTTQKMTTEHVEKEKGGAFVASDTTTTTVTTEHRDEAKKGVFEKIMEKLPGHHSTH